MNSPSSRSYRWLFWWLVLAGLAIDQGSKYLIFANLYQVLPDGKKKGDYVDLIPSAFRLETAFTDPNVVDATDDWMSSLRTVGGDVLPHVNSGALFGFGQSNNLFFTWISFFAAVAIIYWSLRPASKRQRFLCFSLGLILAGTLGNLYDRLVFDGVRDFLHWHKWFDWPVFNIADCCLVCGAGLLLVEALFAKQPAETAPSPEGALAATPEPIAANEVSVP